MSGLTPLQHRPYTPTRLKKAKVWAVDPGRGDLYVVSFKDRDILVQVEEGIADRPEDIANKVMHVAIGTHGEVAALPVEKSTQYVRCHRLIGPHSLF